jgi:fructose-1,6-bisphosphatase/inositol monophosphatase family enzyme
MSTTATLASWFVCYRETSKHDTVFTVEALRIVELFREVAAAIGTRIQQLDDWGLSGNRDGQYTIDVSADEIALTMLVDAGFGVLSEESGVTHSDRDILVVMDPIDGSTNASAGLPWFGTSLCALDDVGPLVSLVVNQATGTAWHAIRGQGAFRDNRPISPSTTELLSDAFISVSGLPDRHFGWRQFRCFGAAALDICSVADGTFDAFADLSIDAHGSWDYLGALLICQEAGGVIVDVAERDLVARGHGDRRTPIAAATPALLSELMKAVKNL